MGAAPPQGRAVTPAAQPWHRNVGAPAAGPCSAAVAPASPRGDGRRDDHRAWSWVSSEQGDDAGIGCDSWESLSSSETLPKISLPNRAWRPAIGPALRLRGSPPVPHRRSVVRGTGSRSPTSSSVLKAGQRVPKARHGDAGRVRRTSARATGGSRLLVPPSKCPGLPAGIGVCVLWDQSVHHLNQARRVRRSRAKGEETRRRDRACGPVRFAERQRSTLSLKARGAERSDWRSRSPSGLAAPQRVVHRLWISRRPFKILFNVQSSDSTANRRARSDT